MTPSLLQWIYYLGPLAMVILGLMLYMLFKSPQRSRMTDLEEVLDQLRESVGLIEETNELLKKIIERLEAVISKK